MTTSYRVDDYPENIPDSIQPHGVLLVLDESDFSILQISANTEQHFGMEPQQLLGQPLSTLLDPAPIQVALAEIPDLNRVVPLPLKVNTTQGAMCCDGFVHRTDHGIILELEPAERRSSFLAIHSLVQKTLYQLQQATDRATLFKHLVEAVQRLTDYDRVHVYRFDADGSGEVIAEAVRPNLPPYLGLHFPAMDIPTWVRETYCSGKLRAVADMQATPVSLVPAQHPQTAEPLNLGSAMLRSPDACCVEYYRNMGMDASLVVSLIRDQTLWGLLACHHSTPKLLPHETRAACELLAQMTTATLGSTVKQERLEAQAQQQALQSELIDAIAQAETFVEALIHPEERLLQLVNATGAAIGLGEEINLVGTTPTTAAIQNLVAWVESSQPGDLFHTHCLSAQYPEAETFKAEASGVLLLRISKVRQYWIAWFRPEVLQTVNWGGKPDQGVQFDEEGQIQLSPRTSFALWQETVQATALPWQPLDIKGALDLRTAIVGIVLKQAEELDHLNRELQRSNRELASFAYAAAHDLKEPLRGIYNYANILQEDYGSVLDAEGMEFLGEIQGFSQRMETLINALLRIAQLRQKELHVEPFDMNEGLQNAEKVVRASWPEVDFELRIPRPIPLVQGDPALLNEVLRNLLNNALKYNEQLDKWIEIGYEAHGDDGSEGHAWTFYVRDNGIGIRPEHQSIVFKLFKRLHPQEHYGGGAGVGLAIVNQIIERHQGQIWIESIFGEGSTFYFTLQSA
ncbi:MAG: ATP-binding protein [Leptolyngbyaceae cyanobacterium]